MLMCHGSNGRDIRNTVLRVADRLNVDGSRVLVNGFVKLRWVIPDDPFDVNLEFAQIYSELVETAAVYYGDEMFSMAET